MMTSTAPAHLAPATARSRSAARLVAAALAFSVGITGLNAVVSSPDASAAQPVVLADSFSRVVTAGWGTAETGGAWTVRGGSAGQYNVNGSAATISLAPGDMPNVDARGVVVLDTDITATVAVNRTTSTNSGAYTTLVSRRRSTNEQYAAILSLATSPPLIQVIRRDSAATQINLGATALLTGTTYRAGDQWRMRFATTGTNPTTLQVKAWPAGSTEPSAWTVTRTDSTPVLQAPGSPGFSAYLSRKATGGNVQVSVFDLKATAGSLCSAPAQLTATPGDGRVALAWAPVSGADAYQVRRDGVLVASPTSPALTDSGLVNGTSYGYSVAAVNSVGAGPAAAVTATPAPSLPAAPTGVTATAGDARVALSWSAVNGADGYRVYRDGSQVGSPTAASFTDTGLVNGTSYSYTVVATNLAGASAPSNALTARPMPPVPAAPTGLTALPGDRQVRLAWSPVAGATSYDVVRDGTVVATPATTSFVDATLANGTTYSYAVAARNIAGPSAASAVVTATPVPPVPAAPSGLVAVAGSTRVTLTWTAVPSATSYSVYRDGTRVAVTTSPSVVDTGLVDETTYAYSVTAANSSGTSPSSSVVLATPLPPVPATPTGLTATAGSTTVALSWAAVPGASGYVVARNGVVAASVPGTSYTDTGLVNGTTYGYTVAASNVAGTSAASSVVSATPLPPRPAAPTGLAAVAGDASVALTWSAVSGATGYTVQRNGTTVRTVTTTTTTDTGLVNGTAYSYTVTATNLGGSSLPSAAVTATPSGSSGSSIPAPPAGWTTTFVDDFTGTTVDSTKWNVRNNQANSNEQSYLLARNVTVADGILSITAKREAVGGKAYTSGYLDSIGKFSQRYGIWQVRAKVNTPIGHSQGMWPAPVWLRGDTSPMEVDLIEAWGTGPTVLNGYRAGSGSSSIHQDTNGGGGKVSAWLADAGTDLSAAFHVYEAEWSPTFLIIRVDGVEKLRATPANAPWAFSGTDYAGKANMRVNLQVSKDDGYYGGPIASTTLPSSMQIDYIRVMTKP